jgi:putative CocE/NonD family hydrolase
MSATETRPARLAPGYADVTVERDVPCPLRDGVVLRADVYRPATEVSLPVLPSPSLGGHSCCTETVAPMGPADQEPYEASKGVLIYTTAPLERDVVLLGDASVELHASSTARDTDFTARLCAVDRDGRSSNLLKEGIVRARFRDSLSEPALLEPGEVYRFTIPLGPVGVRLQAGQRIRLDVSSSDFPQWDRNLNTGGPLGAEPASAAVVATQAVFHDRTRPSRLRLPVERASA